MKRGKLTVFVLTVLFAAIAVAAGRHENGVRNFPFSVTVTSGGSQEEIRCMKIGGEYYVFLPGYGQGSAAQIRLDPRCEVSVDGKPLQEGQSCGDFPVNTKLELYCRTPEDAGYETVTFVRSGGVATMYIDVASGSMYHIHARKGNGESASVRLYREDGTLDYSGSAESVKGRGNATWQDAEKKPYNLEFSQEADLLGMGKAGKWVLLANAFDGSHIRNKIAYDMAAAAGLAFTPETNWVDLYLNGEYAGLYLLSERNEIHAERVDIPAETGFLVSMEIPYRMEIQNIPFAQTRSGLGFRIHHTSVSQAELENIWQSVENAILAEDGTDPVTGKNWQELIDLDSWAHKYLLEELLGNFDAGSISQFFYGDLSEPGAKIYAGPIWDFDNSMGSKRWEASNPRSFLANRAHFYSAEDITLFHGLYQKPAFYEKVVELFETVYEPLLKQLLDSGLQSYVQTVATARSMDQVRWELEDARDAETIESFLRERLECYRDLWLTGTEYCTVEITVDYSTWGCYLVPKGSCLEQLPDNGITQWYDTATGEPFDITRPIVKDIRICPVTG